MNNLGDALATKIIDPYTLEVIQKRVEFLIKNPPNMICVNVILNENSALRYAILKEIIMHSANITEQEADWYILVAGVESELKKMAVVGVQPNNASNS